MFSKLYHLEKPIMKVTSLWRYPIKSCAGTKHNSLTVGTEGFVGDRRFQWVTDSGRFVTQREFPILSQVSARIEQGVLHCRVNGRDYQLQVGDHSAQTEVTIWDDVLIANAYDNKLNQIVSGYLGFSVKLVQIPDLGRPISQDCADGYVSFADGLPYLLCNQQSLNDLNQKLSNPVTMLNFRPNIVVDGNLPYEEDDWYRIRIGDLVFVNVKPCKRCVLTTVDPATGVKSKDAEPLKTLATYRQPEPGAILFGINMIVEGQGEVRVGDDVVIL
jgi:uncharacterized protein YcbX